MNTQVPLTSMFLVLSGSLAFADAAPINPAPQGDQNPIIGYLPIVFFLVILLMAVIKLGRKSVSERNVEMQTERLQRIEVLLERIAKAVERK